MAKLYELLTRDAESETILTDIYRTVIEAVRTKLIGTNFISRRYGPADIPGKTLSIVAQTKNALIVHQVGEGQEIPISVDAVFNFTTTPLKYGVRPVVTREMQEDSQFAFIERNLREAGYQFGRKLDSLILTAARAGAGQTVTGAAAITIDNITTAMNRLEANYALYLAEKRPITVERYNDVTKQLDGIVLSSRWQAGIIPTATAGTTTNAIQLITTT